MPSTSRKTPLRFTAHVLNKNPGPLGNPFGRPIPGNDRWALLFNVYCGEGPPSAEYGRASDLYFEGQRRVFYRGLNAWVEWDGASNAFWPQDPDHPVPTTVGHRIVFLPRRGLFWGGKTNRDRALRERGGPKRVNASEAITKTIEHWASEFKRTPDSVDAGDIETIARRLAKGKGVDLDEQGGEGAVVEHVSEAQGDDSEEGDDSEDGKDREASDGKRGRESDSEDEIGVWAGCNCRSWLICLQFYLKLVASRPRLPSQCPLIL